MREIHIPRYVTTLMERLETAGEEVYLVGGSLRDILLGLAPHDFDLATSALPEKTLSLFSDHRVIETGVKHGTVTVISEGNPVEITTFRIDGSYTDSRHPDGVTFTRRIVDDLARRDFTVNAMAYHPSVGLVDPFGGKEDLAACLLRAVGNPETRFTEDALRIMRALRFSAQLSFSIEGGTRLGLATCRDGLASIAKERIASELLRLLLSPDPYDALMTMTECGITPYVLGGYRPTETICKTLYAAAPADGARLGHLLSDASQEEAQVCLSSLKYSGKQITSALAVARGCHHTVTTPADARRLIAACGAWAPAAVRSSVALGISPPEAIGFVEENPAPCTLSELAVSGKDLTDLGFRGKAVGDTLHALLDAVLEDPTLNTRESLLALLHTIKQSIPNS